MQLHHDLEALRSLIMALDAGELPHWGELIYVLRSEFLVKSDQTNDEKYIHGTFLQLYQYLEVLWSQVVALDTGEFPRRGELIYMLRTEFRVESDQTNDEKYIHRAPMRFYQHLEALQSPVLALDIGEFPLSGGIDLHIAISVPGGN